MNSLPVFHNISRVNDVLNLIKERKEVKELLEIASQYIKESFRVEELQQKIVHPFVVVEGLDAAGKTTLTVELERLLKATRMYTPPAEINHLRKYFDAQPEDIRRAYYCIGNYIVSFQISDECQTRPVIMDRFWHSTAAYGLANACASGLPSDDDPVFTWPSDLIKPSRILFLSVLEKIRIDRILRRDGEQTKEEQNLAANSDFRQRLWDAYRRMSNPSSIEIDASDSVEEVIKKAKQQLFSLCPDLENR